MRWLLWVIALAAAAIGLILLARVNEGYVLLVTSAHRIELSLNFAIVLVLVAIFAGYLLVRTVSVTLSMPRKVREFRKRRRVNKERNTFADALRNYFEGRFGKAERAASAVLSMDSAAGLAALIGAWSAHGRRDYALRDDYLAKVTEFAPSENVARLMAQAEMFLDERRYLDALNVLRQLPEKHTEALKLELRARELAHDWDAVLKLLPQLEKRKVYDRAMLHQIRRHAYVEILRDKAIDLDGLRAYWSRLPSEYKSDPRIAATAAQCFLSFGSSSDAHKVVEVALAAGWDPDLVIYYSEGLGADVKKQLEQAEKWLRDHPQDPVLLLVLGRLCAYQELWGKAQSYLEASLSVEPTHTTHLELARLFERTGRPELATAQYRQALERTLPRLQQATGGRRRPAF
ncbi:MAG: heme biosynthesis protein HemY [Burkholderiales bacterium]|jgi:HemY protein